MAEYTQTGRLISIKVDGQGDDDLLLQSFTCIEAISRPFSIQAQVLCDLPTVDFTTIIGQKATITLKTNDDGNPRYFNGYVSRFAQSGSDPRFHHYNMEIVPWVWFLTRHADCRIFHNLTIPAIVQKVFDGFNAKLKGPIQPKLQASYSKQEYTVQYRETSLNFIQRLMEHAGIYYYFQHSNKDHTLFLADKSAAALDCPIQGSASHLVRNTGDSVEDYVSGIFSRREFKTGIYTSTDYNFQAPSNNMVASENTVISVGGNDPLEIFDYPGVHTTQSEGLQISKIRMEEHEAAHHIINGSGRVRSFLPGYVFHLKDHYRSDLNDSYLLTEVRHTATVAGSYLGDSGDNDSYSNQFTCIPKSIPYRPPRTTPKPYIQGPQTAIVVGKSQDEDEDTSGATEDLWVDKYGRVIVRFPWDRAGACSCRVRVSQEWAGQGWGGMVIPRVGQEVIVGFLEGDPDRPIITGRVYNANNMPPYTLPDYQTRSTFMTRSSNGGSNSTYNELRFEDKTGEEQVFLRAQFDQDNYVLHDSREKIGNDRSLIVGNDMKESIANDVHIQVSNNYNMKVTGDFNGQIQGDSNQKIGGNLSIDVGQDLYEKSGTTFAHEAGQTIHLKGGMTVIIEAGTQLSLKVGGNFIDISPAGVSIVGTMVMINSGGSAGSGPGSSPKTPADPKDPDKADDGSKGTKM